MVIAALILALTGSDYAILCGLCVVLVTALYCDRSAFRRLGRPRFWLFSLVVVLLAGLLLGRDPQKILGLSVSIEGLRAGLIMNVRAYALVLGLVLISRSVTRNSFLRLTTRIGLPHYVPAFKTALEILPRMQSAWRDSRGKNRRFGFSTLVDFLLLARDLAGSDYRDEVTVFALTGRRLSGKTTLLRRIYREAVKKGIQVGGYLQERFRDDENRLEGFKLVSLTTAEEITIAERSPGEPYSFNDGAFEMAASWLARDADPCRLLLVDEMGMLESRGEGHAPGVTEVLSRYPHKVWVMTLRKDRLDALTARFYIKRDNLINLDIEAVDREGFINRVISVSSKAVLSTGLDSHSPESPHHG